MRKFFFRKTMLFLWIVLLCSNSIFSQNNRKQLEKQKEAIQKELKEINALLFKNKKQKAKDKAGPPGARKRERKKETKIVPWPVKSSC